MALSSVPMRRLASYVMTAILKRVCICVHTCLDRNLFSQGVWLVTEVSDYDVFLMFIYDPHIISIMSLRIEEG
jgi:hypothetical protein